MIEIPPRGDEPRIKIFENLDQLQESSHQKICHGLYDPKENLILATYDSVAHEVAHFRDFRSGRLKNPHTCEAQHLKMESRIRNEVVAILFSFAKCGEGGASLDYEFEFLKWLRFMRSRSDFGPTPAALLHELRFDQMQDLAEWLSLSSHPWFGRLEFLFRNYLQDEHFTLTYSARRG